jgi:hypothetical protein
MIGSDGDDCVSDVSGISCVGCGAEDGALPAQARMTDVNTIVTAINGKIFRGEKSILLMRRLPV